MSVTLNFKTNGKTENSSYPFLLQTNLEQPKVPNTKTKWKSCSLSNSVQGKPHPTKQSLSAHPVRIAPLSEILRFQYLYTACIHASYMSDAVIAIWCEEQLKLALRNLKHQAWDFPYSL